MSEGSETNEVLDDFKPEPVESPEPLEPETEAVESPFEAQEVLGSELNEAPQNFQSEPNGAPVNFRRDPIDMICPKCGVTITTNTSSEITTLGFDSSSCFYACLMCCFGSSREIITHRCPACDAELGTYFVPRIDTPLMSNSRENIGNHNAGEHIIDHEDIEIREEKDNMAEVNIEDAEDKNLEDGDCGSGDNDGVDGGDCGGGDGDD